MTIRHVLVLVTLMSCASPDPGADDRAQLELEAEAATPPEPTIRSVKTDDGFTQIRQNATASLVIKGKQLATTTSVTVGNFFVAIDSVAAREVHVSVFTDSASPVGPVDVAVTTDTGSALASGAIELTPFVVSPAATTGHGTFQSPMSLCDPELQFAGEGSTVLLLAGTHHCGQTIFIGAGATISGDPARKTVVTGTDTAGFGMIIDFGSPSTMSTLRDLTFAAPLATPSLELGEGSLVAQRVVSTGTLTSISDGLLTLDDYKYHGPGTGLDVRDATVTNSTFRHCGDGDGIRASGALSLDNVTIADCAHGLLVQRTGGASVTNSHFVANAIGVQLQGGFNTIVSSVVRDRKSNPQADQIGIVITNGTLSATDVKITGQDIGIEIAQFSSDGFSAGLFGDNLLIIGGRFGVAFAGIDNGLNLFNSTIRDQTAASVAVSSLDSFINLGTPFQPGNNTLSVVSGFALDDTRSNTDSAGRFINATGTTLNGVSFAGQTIAGPAELPPYYRVTGLESGIQF